MVKENKTNQYAWSKGSQAKGWINWKRNRAWGYRLSRRWKQGVYSEFQVETWTHIRGNYMTSMSTMGILGIGGLNPRKDFHIYLFFRFLRGGGWESGLILVPFTEIGKLGAEQAQRAGVRGEGKKKKEFHLGTFKIWEVITYLSGKVKYTLACQLWNLEKNL